LFPDMSEETYHGDPVPGGSLSSSGARAILPPNAPARFKWERDHPQPTKKVFEFGSAAHRLVLSKGNDIVEVKAKDWRTKSAKMQASVARAFNRIPLLTKDMAIVEAMAKAIKDHPLAASLLDPDSGDAEQTGIWTDGDSEINCRVRFDWLPFDTGKRMLIPDYKTCVSAEPKALAKSFYNYGYHQQADWYLSGARALKLCGDDAVFLFICQEKTAPFLVTVAQLDAEAMRVAADRNRQARDLFAECTAADRWPDYTDQQLATISLPAWA